MSTRFFIKISNTVFYWLFGGMLSLCFLLGNAILPYKFYNEKGRAICQAFQFVSDLFISRGTFSILPLHVQIMILFGADAPVGSTGRSRGSCRCT